jgi:hypothetical protein
MLAVVSARKRAASDRESAMEGSPIKAGVIGKNVFLPRFLFGSIRPLSVGFEDFDWNLSFLRLIPDFLLGRSIWFWHTIGKSLTGSHF